MSERPGSPAGGGGTFATFFRSEAASSILLLAVTVSALAWANSPWSGAYDALLHAKLGVSWGGTTRALSLQHWVNDGLMALFFFVVGLEIKREVVVGQLSTIRSAALPVAAAAGGMLVPAILFAAVNAGGPGARGWGVPMAPDIAFALGVLALLGPRVPLGLKVFLTALAIADDLGAVLVISVFYTEQVRLGALLAAAGLLGLLHLAGRLGVRRVGAYAVLVVGAWAATLASGVHATVAGVLVALLLPVGARIGPDAFLAAVRGSLSELEQARLTRTSMVLDKAQMAILEELHRATGDFLPPALVLEHYLHPVAAYAVLPLFALFNAGVRIDGSLAAALAAPASLGILLGLLLGKQAGITLACWLAVRLGKAELPEGVTLAQIHGASVLAGIGFTMSIFVAELAFADAALLASAKIGVLAASLLAGVVGYLVLRLQLRRAA
jgi:NhaA family Na+:H+ antiporter